ncbi:capsule assembly Wzi family protein [Emticicia sp. W12TSBA100-4]|uniref:capsule assembly Wzi family protein n=1 Tax=Emticicia sp. W12TSBA100-4 TaxID=3160965 RepID=UPI0033057A1A
MIRKLLTLFLQSIFCVNNLFSQSLLLNTKYQLEAGTYLSTAGVTPFWLRSNQYGIVPIFSPILTFRGSVQKNYDSTKNDNKKLKKFGYGYGFWGIVNVGKQSSVLLPEAYLKIRYEAFEFYGGRRREIMGLVDTALTSGSYIWSGNALPIPKVQISIPNYKQLGKSSIFVKIGISHGWFGNQGYVKNYYLHQKWLYGRIGQDNSKFKFYAGFNHQVQWGGVTQNIDPLYSKNGKLAPYPLYSYQFVLIPFLQKLIKLDIDKLTSYDSGLAIGNHLGSADIGFEFEKNGMKLLLYKQQPYDFARSLYTLNNIEDGLYGLSINLKKNYIVKNVLIEYLYTVSQGLYRFGKYKASNYVENDNYFSHGQYISYDYNSLIMGTPFILLNERGIYNNRVKAFSFYLNGTLVKKFSYLFGGTFSSNLGIYGINISKNQFLGKINTNYSLKKNAFLLSQVTFDIGTLYSKNLGLSVIFRKNL